MGEGRREGGSMRESVGGWVWVRVLWVFLGLCMACEAVFKKQKRVKCERDKHA